MWMSVVLHSGLVKASSARLSAVQRSWAPKGGNDGTALSGALRAFSGMWSVKPSRRANLGIEKRFMLLRLLFLLLARRCSFPFLLRFFFVSCWATGSDSARRIASSTVSWPAFICWSSSGARSRRTSACSQVGRFSARRIASSTVSSPSSIPTTSKGFRLFRNERCSLVGNFSARRIASSTVRSPNCTSRESERLRSCKYCFSSSVGSKRAAVRGNCDAAGAGVAGRVVIGAGAVAVEGAVAVDAVDHGAVAVEGTVAVHTVVDGVVAPVPGAVGVAPFGSTVSVAVGNGVSARQASASRPSRSSRRPSGTVRMGEVSSSRTEFVRKNRNKAAASAGRKTTWDSTHSAKSSPYSAFTAASRCPSGHSSASAAISKRFTFRAPVLIAAIWRSSTASPLNSPTHVLVWFSICDSILFCGTKSLMKAATADRPPSFDGRATNDSGCPTGGNARSGCCRPARQRVLGL